MIKLKVGTKRPRKYKALFTQDFSRTNNQFESKTFLTNEE